MQQTHINIGMVFFEKYKSYKGEVITKLWEVEKKISDSLYVCISRHIEDENKCQFSAQEISELLNLNVIV